MICNVLRNSPASNFHIHLRFGNFLSIEKCDGIGNNTIRLKYTNEKLQLLLYVCAMLRRLERSKKKREQKEKRKRKDIEGHRRKDGARNRVERGDVKIFSSNNLAFG